LAAKTQSAAEQLDHNVDRYPDARTAIRRVAQEAVLPEGPIERLEFTFLAGGEATYRVWAARAEEPEGGYLPPPNAA
jgi:hypothetical protein